MSGPRVYGVCDLLSVAETLAVILEPQCAYETIESPVRADGQPLPRPAVLVDARRPSTRNAAGGAELRHWWPNVAVVRIDLRSQLDPFTLPALVFRAARSAHAVADVAGTIGAHVAPLLARVRPRLTATRWLLRTVANTAPTPTPFATLLGEQLNAIAAELDRALVGARP